MSLAFVGGWGGLVGVIVWWQIIDILNTRRPPEDQIPAAIVTWRDFTKHYPLPVWRHVREFHLQFPESKLYFWYWASIIWMFAFLVASFGIMFRVQNR